MKTSLLAKIIALNIYVSLIILGQTTNNITSKYDFIPGDKVIFYDDFTTENLGEFPTQWNTNGSGEIVTYNNFEGQWFQMTKQGYFIPEANENFTDNYTIEFDIIFLNLVGGESVGGIDFFLLSTSLKDPQGGSQPGQAGFKMHAEYETVSWNNWSEAREWQGDQGDVKFTFKSSEKYHFAIWVQKQRIRVYTNEDKILDLPRGLQSGYNYNVFRTELVSDEFSSLISNFRIAAGLPDMRNKLITEGKLVTYGILFDVNSDKLKPESFPTIKEIAAVLKENPNVKVKIVGHTDSDGADDLNLDLSKRRSDSVKNELINTFGIEDIRLETEGKGETVPVAPNDSGINKAKNRRVEFIKL